MDKSVLVISASPRKGGNSDFLADEFMRGAIASGNTCQKIRLAEKNINYCRGCGNCYSLGNPCPQKDDAPEIAVKMINTDVIVFASPVYFYAPCAQLKTLIDRCCARYQEMEDKDIYMIFTCSDSDPNSLDSTLTTMRGFIRCLPNAAERGIIYGTSSLQPGDVRRTEAPERAYAMGKSV